MPPRNRVQIGKFEQMQQSELVGPTWDPQGDRATLADKADLNVLFGVRQLEKKCAALPGKGRRPGMQQSREAVG